MCKDINKYGKNVECQYYVTVKCVGMLVTMYKRVGKQGPPPRDVKRCVVCVLADTLETLFKLALSLSKLAILPFSVYVCGRVYYGAFDAALRGLVGKNV